jgi:RND family efflux transporter MFP subunit
MEQNMAGDLSALLRERGDPADYDTSAAERVPLPRRRWQTRILVPGLILGVTGVVLAIAAGDALWPSLPVRVVPVIVKAGIPGGAVGKVVAQAPGWVEADPYAVSVSALADGVVQEVLVLEGATVQAGQVVARLIDEDARLALARAEARVAESEADLKAAQAALEAAERTWEFPVELERSLATSEAERAEKLAELERWPAELKAEEALAAELEAEYRRIVPLYEAGQTSEIEYIRAQQQFEAQRAKAAAMRERKAVLEAQLRAIEAEVAAAREHLRLRIADTQALAGARAAEGGASAKLAEVRAMRDEAALRLARMEVRSPVDGVVMTRLVEPGTKLMLNSDTMLSTTVVRLYDPQKLQVRVDVPLGDAASVGVGQAAEVVVDVLPERVFSGRVTRIVNEADVAKNTLQVKVAIEEPSPELKPEMLARARFLSNDEQPPDQPAVQNVFIPESLLGQGAGHQHVWLADQARNVAVMRVVTPGTRRSDRWIEIVAGLQPGDRLIADPPSTLRDGQRIRIVGEAQTQGASGGAHGTH